MQGRAKTISIKHLHAAVKSAAAVAHAKYPGVKISRIDEFVYWPHIICGFPIPWPWLEGGVDSEHSGFAATFSKALSEHESVASLSGELGKVEPAAFVHGGHAIIGVRPGAAMVGE